MPKGAHGVFRGGENHWFRCPCGHQWKGATQRSKDLAYRLHGRTCNAPAVHRPLRNVLYEGPDFLKLSGPSQVIEKCIEKSEAF